MASKALFSFHLTALCALVVAALLVPAATLQAAQTLPQQVEAAKTPADHEALAQRYEQKRPRRAPGRQITAC